MLEVLDTLFHVIHISFIIINTTFWMSKRTLRIAQVTLLATLTSWFGFGIFYGFGYCFLTDWHWQIKEKLGETDLPLSYIKLVMDRTTGRDWNAEVIDKATMIILILSVTGCIIQTFRLRNRNQGISLRGPS